MTTARSHATWAFVICSLAIFITALDNLVVTTALARIHQDLGGGIEALEWTVNGYTLAYAIFLLSGAACGDRFGRRRIFVVGMAIFTLGSAAAAAAPSIGLLIAARALQGVGGAIVTPLTMTILVGAVPPARRGLALGTWGAVAGLAIALGPLLGGVVTHLFGWQWIFWLNVPIGLAAMPLAQRRLAESHGPNDRLDVPGVGLASVALLGIVWALVRGSALGWTSVRVLGATAGGLLALAAFVAWELRAPAPMLPMRFFAQRAFLWANVASFAMYFGMFGSVFLLAQFLQLVVGYTPLEAGLRTLAWTAMPLFVAPMAGGLSDRLGGRPILAFGLVLHATALEWLATVATPGISYEQLVPAMVLAGTGVGCFFSPVASVVMAAVRPEECGQASGATNAIREVGGVLGVAVLAAIFAHHGAYGSAATFVQGCVPALHLGAAVVGLGALAALLIPARRAAVFSAANAVPQAA
jgi:EmrB/QacA subfamily drug resistance transporter